ncbi:LysM peptidoglycan-binding domain-containing protein [Paraglaciecola aquimarina]|uniref:LysM peptidoglycan-binding domain-containing protein n=1 Tax=Paraglaciecola algarum TaxID=3050085 RepID=A0ABS9D451_9ALTE|nr:LysM peptidoglycan-binding domain-containing protein [Paraglaciecola sp. G1-23]MCF2946823.1 LysM peptidoglycan-binding domain-containing protein [Paraglaciecola sp. G1-23]
MRIHSLAILVLAGFISACETTQSVTQAETVESNKLVDESPDASCSESELHAEQELTCDTVNQGTFPISHPVEPIEVTVTVPDKVAEAAEEEQIKDLWARVQSQLQFKFTDNKRIAAQRNWYLKHPEYMQRVAKRAKPFLYLIIEQLEQQNMPLDLALLPIVESAFDPFAYSHGRAAGMWQFIPSTGTRFGMKQTWWYDGRRDVMASTQGAINYLNYLLKMFDGNWYHALAAYNSGEGRVLRAVRKNKKSGKQTDFWSLDLPRETEAYVPKLLALVDILANSDKYNFAWPLIDNIPFTQEVEIGSQIDLALAAQMAQLSVKELHALNPGYNRWATDPNGPHKLLIPIDKVDRFETELAKTDDKQRLNWVRHKVKSGDSLIKLAKKYHTSTDVISQVNKLKGNMIRVNDYLIVPVALKSLDAYSLSQEQRLAKVQSQKSGSSKLTHKVKSGDTFWDISREYKVNLRSLAKWNGMAPTDTLRPGKELVIWLNQTNSKALSTSAANQDAIMRSLTYTVRNGDSLARIAGKFKVKVKDLQKWNQSKLKKYLQPGQKLKIYVDITRT